jgi:hypothetical protein
LDDVVAAIIAAVDRRTQLSGETILLIGEAETLSYDEIQHLLGCLIHGEEFETREIPKSVAKAGSSPARTGFPTESAKTCSM